MSSVFRYTALLLLLGIFGYVFLYNLSGMRLVGALGLGFSYFLWGIITHALDKNLHFLTAAEYLVVSALAVIILLSLSL